MTFHGNDETYPRLFSALSISAGVRSELKKRPQPVRVMGVHRRVCNLRTSSGGFVSITWDPGARGPFHILLTAPQDIFSELKIGMSGWITKKRLSVGPVTVDLETALPWNPKPDWPQLPQPEDPPASPTDTYSREATDQPVRLQSSQIRKHYAKMCPVISGHFYARQEKE